MISRRRLRARARTIAPVLFLTLMNLVAVVLVAGPAVAQGAARFVQVAAAAFTGGTITSGLVVSGVTDDIASSTGEDLALRGGGTSGSSGGLILQSRSDISSVLDSSGNTEAQLLTSTSQTSLIIRQGSSSSTGTLKVNGTYAQVGSGGNVAAGTSAGCFNESTTAGGGTDLVCASGNGALEIQTSVSSLTGLCDAAAEVGDVYMYSRAASNKITMCVCEQTAAATFAFGAATASGDCT